MFSNYKHVSEMSQLDVYGCHREMATCMRAYLIGFFLHITKFGAGSTACSVGANIRIKQIEPASRAGILRIGRQFHSNL